MLSHNPSLGDYLIAVVAQNLKRQTELETLSLTKSGISASGLAYLCQAMNHVDTMVTNLSVRGNNLSSITPEIYARTQQELSSALTFIQHLLAEPLQQMPVFPFLALPQIVAKACESATQLNLDDTSLDGSVLWQGVSGEKDIGFKCLRLSIRGLHWNAGRESLWRFMREIDAGLIQELFLGDVEFDGEESRAFGYGLDQGMYGAFPQQHLRCIS